MSRRASGEKVGEAVDFPVSRHLKTHAYSLPASLPWWERPLAVAAMLASMIFLVWRREVLYLFMPGKLPVIAGLIAILFRKKYGVYVRGESEDFPGYRLVVKHAAFAIVTGSTLTERVKTLCPNAQEAVPMCSVFEHTEPRKSGGKAAAPRGVFIGRGNYEKGLMELLEGLTALHNENIDFSFRFIGACMPEIVEAYQNSPIRDRVKFSGHLDSPEEMARELAEADFFCFPSYTEGFPRAIYDALYYSLPVLTTLVGSIGGVMKDGVNCLAFPPRDAAALTNALRKIVTDEELRQKMSLASAETFKFLAGKFYGNSHARQVCGQVCRLKKRNRANGSSKECKSEV